MQSDCQAEFGRMVLVAEDDPVSADVIRLRLESWGYEPVLAGDGRRALEILKSEPRIRLAILDWMMPVMDGIDVIRHLREDVTGGYVYVIMLTSMTGKKSFLEAMEAGADDFMTKPFDPDEMKARLGAARRVLSIHSRVSRLEQLLPICMYCKKIRSPVSEWEVLESYIESRTGSGFTHSICPTCYEARIRPQLER